MKTNHQWLFVDGSLKGKTFFEWENKSYIRSAANELYNKHYFRYNGRTYILGLIDLDNYSGNKVIEMIKESGVQSYL